MTRQTTRPAPPPKPRALRGGGRWGRVAGMSRLTRLLLLWLVALALPLQGMAAAVRLGCLPGGAAGHAQHALAVAAASPAHTANTGHTGLAGHMGHTDPASAAAHHVHAPAEAMTADTAGAGATGAPDPSLQHSTPHTCSACAACCLGTGLLAPPLGQPLAMPLVHGLVFQVLQVGPVHFVTGGPDRPPRTQA